MPKVRPKSISRHSSLSTYNPENCEITPLIRRASEHETRLAYKKGKIVGAALSFIFMVLIALFVIFYDRLFLTREEPSTPPMGIGTVSKLILRLASKAWLTLLGGEGGVSAVSRSRIHRFVDSKVALGY